MTAAEHWCARALTLQAMALLLLARGLVAAVPFARWQSRLGLAGAAGPGDADEARQLAGHVNRGATRLGFPLKCLPRAMALSWLLRRRGIAHNLVIAARPQAGRAAAPDPLHAWIECSGEMVLGKLDGPWIEVHTMP